MSDLAPGGHLPVISSLSPNAVGLIALGIQGTGITVGSLAWPSANRAVYIPFVMRAPYLVRQLWWANGSTAAGNVDVGVYTVGGTLLTSAGSTAQSGTSTIQAVDITDLTLSPGSYYMAMAMSSTSGTAFVFTFAALFQRMCGIAQQASALPLPATSTLAAASGTVIPLFGFTSRTVI